MSQSSKPDTSYICGSKYKKKQALRALRCIEVRLLQQQRVYRYGFFVDKPQYPNIELEKWYADGVNTIHRIMFEIEVRNKDMR